MNRFLAAFFVSISFLFSACQLSPDTVLFQGKRYRLSPVAGSAQPLSRAKHGEGVSGFLYFQFPKSLQKALHTAYNATYNATSNATGSTATSATSTAAPAKVPLSFSVHVECLDAGDVDLGFLYESDFLSLKRGVLRQKLDQRPFATVCAVPGYGERLSISFGFGDAERLPCGIILHSSAAIRLGHFSVEPLYVGWELVPAAPPRSAASSGSVPSSAERGGLIADKGAVTATETVHYGFSYTGGSAPYAVTCPEAFRFGTAQDYVRPGENATIELTFDPSASAGEYRGNPVVLQAGRTKLTIRRTPMTNTVHVFAPRLSNGGESVTISAGAEQITGIQYQVAAPGAPRRDQAPGTQATAPHTPAARTPVLADPGLIVRWSTSLWRDPAYEVFRWEQCPSVLIIDFADYAVQDDMLKRLAFFAEKAGYKGTLAPDDLIKNQHGFNAHDYRPETLAAFYSLAAAQNFPLNERERELEALLVQEGIIVPQNGDEKGTGKTVGKGAKAKAKKTAGTDAGSTANAPENTSAAAYTAGTGAIVSISQESTEALRWQLINHEAFHGIYFTDATFRALTEEVYNTMDAQSLAFMQGYFTSIPSLNYDPADDYLMKNEMMGYLLQQGVSAIPGYFAGRWAKNATMLRAHPELCEYMTRTNAQGLVDAAIRLQDYVLATYGLAAGRVYLID